jgi:hypothetical protein
MTFTIKLAQANGTPAKPRSFKSTVLAWNPGDRIPMSPAVRSRSSASVTTTRPRSRSWSLRTCPKERLAPSPVIS